MHSPKATDSGNSSKSLSTGSRELDFILGGGLPRNAIFLVEGDPGSGKTTLSLSYLIDGARQGERVLYLTLSETDEDLRAIAASHGWPLDGVQIHEMRPGEQGLTGEEDGVMYHPSEVELGEVTQAILTTVEKLQPDRLVIDSLSEIRHLSQHTLRYQRQLIALKNFLHGRGCTVLLIDDRIDTPDLQLHGAARGTISLEKHTPAYGRLRRRLQVTKMRGQAIRTGYHDFVIAKGGLKIFPRLIASEHQRDFHHEPLQSGIDSLDQMLGGGIQRGTSTLVMGSAGTGKSTLAAQYALATIQSGQKSAIYVFDETAGNYLTRCEGMDMLLQQHRQSGALLLKQVDPAELSPGEFAWSIRRAVEDEGINLIVIDSLNGLFNAMPDEIFLKGQLHELLSYLCQLGVTVILVFSQHGLVTGVESPLETSYLADSIVLLRYFEYAGEVRKAISVVKKRTGGHETSIRELAFDAKGIRIGEPLREFQGVMTGDPKYVGEAGPLLGARNAEGR